MMKLHLPQRLNWGIHVKHESETLDIVLVQLEKDAERRKAVFSVTGSGGNEQVNLTPKTSYRVRPGLFLKMGPAEQQFIMHCEYYSRFYRVLGPRRYGSKS